MDFFSVNFVLFYVHVVFGKMVDWSKPARHGFVLTFLELDERL